MKVKMPELITIGETMVAMVPEDVGMLRYKRNLNIRIAGAESNVAMGVRKLGHTAGWISRLGKDEFGELILREIQSEGVDCSKVIWDEEHPTGLMVKQMETDATKVFYYRKGSAASHMKPNDIEESYFENCKIFHVTGITPVLSQSCKDTIIKSIEFARKKNVLVSFDPNIRKKLWKNQDYAPFFKQILFESDIVEMGVEEGQCLLGVSRKEDMISILQQNNPNVIVAIKDGGNGAYIYHKKEYYFIPPYPCKCVESIGAGDAFNAGFLSGILSNCNLEICGKMGGIAGAMVTEVVGDVENQPDIEKMENCLKEKKEVFR